MVVMKLTGIRIGATMNDIAVNINSARGQDGGFQALATATHVWAGATQARNHSGMADQAAAAWVISHYAYPSEALNDHGDIR
jgi:hypothetical protein